MPDIFTADLSHYNTKSDTETQPIREATPLLIGKIMLTLMIPLVIYGLLLITSLEIQTIFSFHEDWSFAFLIFLGCLTILQGVLILLITLGWKNHVYYISDTYLQENRGIFTLTEKNYDLKNVRDISLRQGVFGRLFNYGDIIIESTAPDFHEVISIIGAPDPKSHEAFLKKFV